MEDGGMKLLNCCEICYKNARGYFSGCSKIIPVGNLNIEEDMETIGNGRYMVEYKRQFFPLEIL